MTGFRTSGATPRAWFPNAWKYYDGSVATFSLVLMVVNALMGAEVFGDTAERWISVGIAAVTAVAIWLRLRAQQLGVVAQTDTTTEVVEPPKGPPPEGQ